MDSLSGIAVFVQVAESKSFSAAGRALGVSASAVGKSIARTEERLAVRLFHRSTRCMELTAEGALFLDRCRRILGEIDAAQNELSTCQASPRGRLRIHMPQLAGLLLPVLNGFMQRYPGIELDIDLSERLVDCAEDGFDLMICASPRADAELDRRKLCSFRKILVAAPSYLARRGMPAAPAELSAHDCLMCKFSGTGLLDPWPVCRDGDVCLPERLTSTAVETIAFLAEQGRGIAFLPDFVVGEALAAGRLKTVLAGQVEETAAFWMLWPSSRHGAPALCAFVDFLSRELKDCLV